MSRKARMRAAAAAAVALVIGLLLTLGISGVFATFSAETQNSNSAFAGGWVAGPTGFNTPVASGNGQYFTWTVGNHAVLNQEVWFADQGSTQNCTGASYTNSLYSGATALANTVTSIDGTTTVGATSSNVPAANQGDYICYQIRSTNNAWYTGTNVGTAVQVGLAPTSIVFSGAGSGHIATNNTIKITFNHNPTYSGAATENIVVAVGSTLSIPGVGTFSGGSITKGGTCTGSTVAASGAILTVTFKGCPGGANSIAVTAGGHPTFAPGANVTSTIGPAGHAYSVSECTVAAVCTPQMAY